jgi:hypothetical protein
MNKGVRWGTTMIFPDMEYKGGAEISEDGLYRYLLWRRWDIGIPMVIIGLNPSKADAEYDDPTIIRCTGLARENGYTSIVMLNLFAYRATEPKDMMKAADPVGPDNDKWLVNETYPGSPIVCAWGKNGSFRGRGAVVLKMLAGRPLYCFDRNMDGSPKHPLFIAGRTKIKEFN